MVNYSVGVAVLLLAIGRVAAGYDAAEAERREPRRRLGTSPTDWPTYSPTAAEDNPRFQPRPTPWPTYSPTEAEEEEEKEEAATTTGRPTVEPTSSAPSPYPTYSTYEPTTGPPTDSPTTKSPSDSPTTESPTVPPPIRTFDSGTLGGTRYSAYLLGKSSYRDNPTSRPIAIVLETDDPGEKWFVAYDDVQVVINRGKDGVRYPAVARLDAGESHVIGDWRGTGMELTITATNVRTTSSPPFAYVEVAFGPDSVAPTTRPSDSPSRRPTVSPTPSPSEGPTEGPSYSPTERPTKRPTSLPTERPTKIPTVSPTARPTNFPTTKPTARPTNFPTTSPTPGPTVSPTAGPTLRCGDSVCDADEGPESCPADCARGQFYTPDRPYSRSSGQMFSIEAKADGVRIQSFDVFAAKGGTDSCTVLTRPGDWKGHEYNSARWETIYAGTPDLIYLKPVSLRLDRDVYIPRGSRASFQVLCSSKNVMYLWSDGKTEGGPYIDDGSVVLHEGMSMKGAFKPKNWGKFATGLTYVKAASADDAAPEDGEAPETVSSNTENPTPSPTTKSLTPPPTTKSPTPLPTTEKPTPFPTTMSPIKSPTIKPTMVSPTKLAAKCGDFVCHADEEPGTCPSDCVRKTFYTPERPDSKSAGQMFALEASTDGVRIQSVHVVSKYDAKDDCMVMTREGDWKGHEYDAEGWEIIYAKKDIQLRKMYPVSLGNFDREVPIPLGSRQSFQVLCTYGIMYVWSDKKTEGEPYVTNGSVVIHEGMAMKGPFQPNGWGKFTTGITYISTAPEAI